MGGVGSDKITIGGDATNVTVKGGDSNDTFTSTSNNVSIAGDAGDD